MKIISIVEFGSSARSDADEYSDKDYFIYADVWVDRKEIEKLTFSIMPKLKELNPDFIIHDKTSFEFMLDRGSLFLWHLKLESKPIYGEQEFDAMLKNLKEFKRYSQKFENYMAVFHDMNIARKALPKITNFDFAILFTVIRNLSILCCFKLGKPKFGRISAFETLKSIAPDINLSKSDYETLMNYKLEYERGFKLTNSKELEIEPWINKVDIFSKQVKYILELA